MPARAAAPLTVPEVALLLGVTTATVYELCDRGEVPHRRVSNAISSRALALIERHRAVIAQRSAQIDADLDALEARVKARRREAWKEALAEVAARDALLRRKPKSERPKCGARTRAGRPCQAQPYREPGEACVRNGRCRMHGGLSTGPRTPEGKEHVRVAARRTMLERWRVRREGPAG